MAKPIICNEKATLYIPDTEEQCEYWLIPVHSVDDISNPDRNHAWILPNGDFYVYDGTSLVQINDLSDLQIQWGNIIGNMASQTDLMDEFKKYVKGVRLNGQTINMGSDQFVNLNVESSGGETPAFNFAVGTILETAIDENPSVYYGGTWTKIQSQKAYDIVGTMRIASVPAGATSYPTHTWSQVQQMFADTYGFTPDNSWSMYASYNNGDGDTNPSHIEGATYLPRTQQYYVLFTSSTTADGSLRVQYHYSYMYDCFKWKKTGE